jgi:F0F1-type ATP synthase assembly protein I
MTNDEPKGSGPGLNVGFGYAGAGLSFVLAMLFFGGLGWWLDGRLHTRPWFFVAGAMIGAFGAFMRIYYRVQRDLARKKDERKP